MGMNSITASFELLDFASGTYQEWKDKLSEEPQKKRMQDEDTWSRVHDDKEKESHRILLLIRLTTRNIFENLFHEMGISVQQEDFQNFYPLFSRVFDLAADNACDSIMKSLICNEDSYKVQICTRLLFKDNSLEMTIADNGEGFPEDISPSMFKEKISKRNRAGRYTKSPHFGHHGFGLKKIGDLAVRVCSEDYGLTNRPQYSGCIFFFKASLNACSQPVEIDQSMDKVSQIFDHLPNFCEIS